MTSSHLPAPGVVTAIGTLGGLCNRTACRAPNARWFNKSTQKHYCEPCAAVLNRENEADAKRLGIHPLCEEVAASAPGAVVGEVPVSDLSAAFATFYDKACEYADDRVSAAHPLAGRLERANLNESLGAVADAKRHMLDAIRDSAAALAAAREEIERLRRDSEKLTALRGYLEHKPFCKLLTFPALTHEACNCGLFAILLGAGGASGQTTRVSASGHPEGFVSALHCQSCAEYAEEMAFLKRTEGSESRPEESAAQTTRPACVECGATDTMLKHGPDGRLRCLRRSAHRSSARPGEAEHG